LHLIAKSDSTVQQPRVNPHLEQRHEGSSGALEGLPRERDELAEEVTQAMKSL
jgi:hypothetical protein